MDPARPAPRTETQAAFVREPSGRRSSAYRAGNTAAAVDRWCQRRLRPRLPARARARAPRRARAGRRGRGHVLRAGAAGAPGVVVHRGGRAARDQPVLVVCGEHSAPTFPSGGRCCCRGCRTPCRPTSRARRTCCTPSTRTAWPSCWRRSSPAIRGRRLAAIEPRPADISGGEQQHERLQALIDSSPLALVEFGLDTRIRLWNPAAERIFGWSREEMLGRGGLPMAPPVEARRERGAVRARARGRVDQRLRDRAPAQGRDARRRLDRRRPGPGRLRPGRRQHGRLHRHHRAQGAGGAAAGADRLLAARARGVRPRHAHPAVEPGGRAHLRLDARGDARPWRPPDGAALEARARARTCSSGCARASR